jgi:hypothetical protein
MPAGVDVLSLVDTVVRTVDSTALEHASRGTPADDARIAHALARISWLAYYGDVPAVLLTA